MTAKIVSLRTVDVDPHSLIPDGDYTIAYKRYAVSTRFGRGSLELWFFVLDFGPYFNRELARYYKIDRIRPTKSQRAQGRRETFRASPRSAFAREFVLVHGYEPPAGFQALTAFKDFKVIATVKTVTRDHLQRPLPEALRYNVIHALKGSADAEE